MKENAILFGNRPFSIAPNQTSHLGNLLDEDIAIKLGFPIRNLQYVRLSLDSNDKEKKTRCVGTVRVTVQTIVHGRPGLSVALSARVIRDLSRLTGSETLVDETLFEKLAPNSPNIFKKKESNGDTSTANDIGTTPTSTTTNKMLKFGKSFSDSNTSVAPGSDHEDSESNTSSSAPSHSSHCPCPDCSDYRLIRDFSGDEEDSASIRRIRSKGKNLFSRIRPPFQEDIEAHQEKVKFQDTPENRRRFLEENFPGGVAGAEAFHQNYIPHLNRLATSMAVDNSLRKNKRKNYRKKSRI